MNEVRRAFVELNSTTTVAAESVIQELGESEVTRRLAWHNIRHHYDTMTIEQRVNMAGLKDRAAKRRSECLRLLGLDVIHDNRAELYRIMDEEPELIDPAKREIPDDTDDADLTQE
jgi:hypothetical protein